MKSWSFLQPWVAFFTRINYSNLRKTSSKLRGINQVGDIQDVISDIGYGIFEVCTVVGVSLFLVFVFWKVILSKFKLKDPDKKVLRFLVDGTVSWAVLFFFEVFIIANEYLFAILVKGYPIAASSSRINYSGYYISIDAIVDTIMKLAWVDLILIGIFYTILGFQAFRKIKQYKSLIRRIVLDFIEGVTFLIEFVILSLPLDIITIDVWFTSGVVVFFFVYCPYWIFVGVLFFESLWWMNSRIEFEREKSGRDVNLNTFTITLFGLFFSISFLTLFLPVPFFFLLAIDLLSFLFVLLLIFFSLLFIVIIYYIFQILGISTSFIQIFDNRTQNFRLRIGVAVAKKGAIFNYPAPNGIIAGDEPSGEPIRGRVKKVKLKIACGHCFHVFTVETLRKGSKIRSFPCPFCGSMATTPVWE